MYPPDSAFSLSSAGKADINATVEQAKSEFTYADGVRIGDSVVATGTVTASGMTAGEWHGQYQFAVSLDAPEPETPEQGEGGLNLIAITSIGGKEVSSIYADGTEVNYVNDLEDSDALQAIENEENVYTGFEETGLILVIYGNDTEITINYTDGSHYTFTVDNAPEEYNSEEVMMFHFDSVEEFINSGI